ncbi:hypothetical protein QQF64_023854 [Cirrhinus molitorella]|uniref:Uncharacterized protein n=1 Tax=Cirrhinus molitorella TaxID=172907 RepID=A0ABR3NJK9_9TELE
MMSGIEKRFFEGGDGGKKPKYSITDLAKHNFKVIGEIFAVSIAQEGPPPNFFSQWCYKYISTGEVDQEAITERDITDPEVMELIKEIKAADNTTVMEFTDRILSCGYTRAVSFEKKEEIVRLVQQETDICRQLFVPGSFCKVDADFLMKSLTFI